jgi:hypothetical protein
MACRTTHVTSRPETRPAGPPPAAAPSQPGMLPEGTALTVRLNEKVGADASGIGDRFTATVQGAVVDGDGTVVVPEGAIVSGHVSGIKQSEHAGDEAAIGLDFDSIRVGAQTSDLEAEVLSTKVTDQPSASGLAATAGVGAGVGVIAGLLFGGIINGWRGALLGGLFGGGTGTMIALGTGDVEPELPAGTLLALRTTAPTRLASIRAIR